MDKKLPENWKIKKLGEVVKVLDNLRKPINSTERHNRISGKNQKDLYAYYGATGQVGWIDSFLTEGDYILVGEDGAPFLDNFKNKAYKITGKTWVNNHAHILKEIENITLNSFILYYLNSIDYRQYVNGTTRLKLTKGSLIEIPFPLPPLQTQQAIVSKIEELFSELDKGIEDLKTAQQQLIVYKKSVLMEGLTGKLTNDWRSKNPNNETSESMFQKIQTQIDLNLKEASIKAVLNGKRKPKDQRNNKKTTNVEEDLPNLPANWNYYRLEDITYLVTDGTHFTPKYQESGIKFLSVKNVRPFYFREEHLKYISQEEHNSLIERCNPQKNDILYTKVGATYGYAAKVTMDYDFSIFVSLCLIKPVHEFFSSDFLELLMNSELVFQQARKRVSGTAVPDLHLIEIRDFKVPLPSLEEQNHIVLELESRLSVADKIEESITQSLQQAEALRQSILKKAFNGQLL